MQKYLYIVYKLLSVSVFIHTQSYVTRLMICVILMHIMLIVPTQPYLFSFNQFCIITSFSQIKSRILRTQVMIELEYPVITHLLYPTLHQILLNMRTGLSAQNQLQVPEPARAASSGPPAGCFRDQDRAARDFPKQPGSLWREAPF